MAATKRKTTPKSKASRVSSGRRASPAKASSQPRASTKRWSQNVTEHSNAMTLERNVFTLDDPHEIAMSLKRSSERSKRRKADPYRSAMSMLTFYINRAGSKLPDKRKRILERAKDELRKAFGKAD
jgi:hypothetical protein